MVAEDCARLERLEKRNDRLTFEMTRFDPRLEVRIVDDEIVVALPGSSYSVAFSYADRTRSNVDVRLGSSADYVKPHRRCPLLLQGRTLDCGSRCSLGFRTAGTGEALVWLCVDVA